jgi:hypothetical protein
MSERLATPDRTRDRLLLGPRLRPVYLPHPVARQVDRSVAQQLPNFRRPVQPRVQAAPRPVLSTLYHAGTQRIALDISKHPQERRVLLDHEALEPGLIDVAGADRPVRDLPARGVRQAQVSEEPRQLAVLARPGDEVPVVAHQTPAQQADGVSLHGKHQHVVERLEILRCAEQRDPAVGAVQHMIDVAARGDASDSWHGCA